MKFTTYFSSHPGYAIELPSENPGINFIDRVRSELEVPSLSADVVSGYISGTNCDADLSLEESTARDSGHYSEKSSTHVKVPRGFLNQFVKVELNTVRDPATGAINTVNGVQKLNKQAVIDAWAEAGYPLRWGFEETSQDS
ncbi:hypothetical protein GCM10027347_44440 [Larkinella harenae]